MLKKQEKKKEIERRQRKFRIDQVKEYLKNLYPEINPTEATDEQIDAAEKARDTDDSWGGRRILNKYKIKYN